MTDVDRIVFELVNNPVLLGALVNRHPIRASQVRYAVALMKKDERWRQLAVIAVAMLINGMPAENVPGPEAILAMLRGLAHQLGVDLGELRGVFKTS